MHHRGNGGTEISEVSNHDLGHFYSSNFYASDALGGALYLVTIFVGKDTQAASCVFSRSQRAENWRLFVFSRLSFSFLSNFVLHWGTVMYLGV